MKRFYCMCGQALSFENVQCLGCGRALGFDSEALLLGPIENRADGWRMAEDPNGTVRRLCRNQLDHGVCNWLTPVADQTEYCVSCQLNQTIPDLTVAGNVALWSRIEIAKRRLVYSLLSLDLPLNRPVVGPGGAAPASTGLRFSFLADTPSQHVVTGHEDGLVTLALAEADDAQRVRTREVLGEPYRTLLGHFRHECGHYYWAALVGESRWHAPFRELFGDETADYAAALAQHYRDGPIPDWSQVYVSAYASSHPHEDWAETWAHYLHIRDTLETAQAHGVSTADLAAPLDESHHDRDFSRVVEAWLPVTVAVNALNRSMGLPDMYPFVLPPPAVAKLQFVHDLVIDTAGGPPAATPAVVAGE